MDLSYIHDFLTSHINYMENIGVSGYVIFQMLTYFIV